MQHLFKKYDKNAHPSAVIHWILQRGTALVILILGLWLAYAFVFTLTNYTQTITWLKSPINSLLLSFFTLSCFYHLYLGLRVIIEDYIHILPLKNASLLSLKGSVLLLSLFNIGCIIGVFLKV